MLAAAVPAHDHGANARRFRRRLGEARRGPAPQRVELRGHRRYSPTRPRRPTPFGAPGRDPRAAPPSACRRERRYEGWRADVEERRGKVCLPSPQRASPATVSLFHGGAGRPASRGEAHGAGRRGRAAARGVRLPSGSRRGSAAAPEPRPHQRAAPDRRRTCLGRGTRARSRGRCARERSRVPRSRDTRWCRGCDDRPGRTRPDVRRLRDEPGRAVPSPSGGLELGRPDPDDPRSGTDGGARAGTAAALFCRRSGGHGRRCRPELLERVREVRMDELQEVKVSHEAAEQLVDSRSRRRAVSSRRGTRWTGRASRCPG